MTKKEKIRIKVITRGQPSACWEAQLPESGSFTGECSFHFSLNETHYDWLVVIDDVSRKLSSPAEFLHCADEHTLLVTTEPPTITHYGTAFCSQFAHVLTSQPPEDLKHPSRIYSHTGNLWFSGHSYAELANKNFPEKSLNLSTVCSSKKQRHTIHNDRYQFCNWLIEQLPDLHLFGHGSNFIQNKFDALDSYRFHLAIENYSGLHHWTEKLADPFLSGCFPIYYGCTNLNDYFPEEGFLEIDIFNRTESLEKIRNIIEDDTFHSSRQDSLHEAKRLIMEDYNLMRMIEILALEKHQALSKPSNRELHGRKQMRWRKPTDAIERIAWRIKRDLISHRMP
jgi:hypothetical protein